LELKIGTVSGALWSFANDIFGVRYPPGQRPLRSKTMSFTNRHQGALITRDAHAALLDLKRLVDSAAKKIHVAERETVGVVIGRWQSDDPLRTLRDAAETLQSPNFEAAVSRAREKMESAVAWHVRVQEK